jgi:hypothetical protein
VTGRRVNGLFPRRRSDEVPGRCGECGERVIWALPIVEGQPRKQRVAVSAQQDIAGNLVLCYEVNSREEPVGSQLVVLAPLDYAGPRWIGHAATCAKAAGWQRRGALRGEL